MLLHPRSTSALCISVLSFVFMPAIAKCQGARPWRAEAQSAKAAKAVLTCDRAVIDPDSYEMATVGQAQTLLTDRSDFWDAFRINKHISTLHYLNLDAQEIAERALRADPRNMMAHSILARHWRRIATRRRRCAKSK